MFYGYDPTYILVIIGAILSMIASSFVQSTYSKYSRVQSRTGMTGAQAAQRILQMSGISDVRIEHVSGKLTDHYDPSQKVVRLSDSVYGCLLYTSTENELRTYVEVGHEDGVIESEEREMIYNVFDFGDAVDKDVMIPRIDMVTVDKEATYEEVMEVFKDCMYTRIPVFEEDKDNIIGLINIKDFILVEDKAKFKISDILRQAYYTYEFKKTADLLVEMRQKCFNVAFVLNEYGGTAGMITLEDLLEEIVGEIRDEYDSDEEQLIQKMQDRTYLVEGSMKLSDINDELGTDLQSEDYDSIGGLIIEHLDRVPEDGAQIVTDQGIRLQVQGVSQNRILKVIMELPEEKAPEDNAEKDSEKEK